MRLKLSTTNGDWNGLSTTTAQLNSLLIIRMYALFDTQRKPHMAGSLQFLKDILHEMFLWEIAVAYVSSILETSAIGFLLYQQANIRIIRSDWSCRLWWPSHFITVCCWKFQLYKSKHMIQGPSTSSHTVCVWNFERRAWWGFIHALVSLEFALRLGDLPSARAKWPGRTILRSRLTHSFLREEQHHRSRAPW